VKLPEAANAVVDGRKVRDDLLSSSHPIGRFKAAFFVDLGYSRDAWEGLASDLRRLATTQDALPVQSTRTARSTKSVVDWTGRRDGVLPS
jgi:Domain of unknown function (DUF6883)